MKTVWEKNSSYLYTAVTGAAFSMWIAVGKVVGILSKSSYCWHQSLTEENSDTRSWKIPIKP